MRVGVTILRLWPTLAALPLAGCMTGNTGLETTHKPVVANGAVRIEKCGDWSHLNNDSATRTNPDYGCTTNANLAAMIADPNDLVHGQFDRDTGADGVRAARAWRDAAKTGGK